MQPFIYYVLAFIGNARPLISTCQIIFLTSKNLFLKISLFQNFVSFLFDFFLKKIYLNFFFFGKNLVMNSVHEPCPNDDSEIVLSRKTGWVHQVHSLQPSSTPRPCAQRPCRAPRTPLPRAPRAPRVRPRAPDARLAMSQRPAPCRSTSRALCRDTAPSLLLLVTTVLQYNCQPTYCTSNKPKSRYIPLSHNTI